MSALANVTSMRLRSLKDRIADIEKEISGVKSQYGISQFELNVMLTLKERDFGSIKQRKILSDIEIKVFGYEREDFEVK